MISATKKKKEKRSMLKLEDGQGRIFLQKIQEDLTVGNLDEVK